MIDTVMRRALFMGFKISSDISKPPSDSGRERQADTLCDLTEQGLLVPLRSWLTSARFRNRGESVSGCGLHVRILPGSVQPMVMCLQRWRG